MKPNRSIPNATVIPVLNYPDVRAAVAWLEQAFGFVERLDIGDGHRSQMRVGDGAVIARQGEVAGGPSHAVMVRVEDCDAACARAREHGARVLTEPTSWQYGERQCTVEDLAGHQWTFTQTLDDVDPADWGGKVVSDT